MNDNIDNRNYVFKFMEEIEDCAKKHGFDLVKWEREILNFGPTITQNYMIKVKDRRMGHKVVSDYKGLVEPDTELWFQLNMIANALNCTEYTLDNIYSKIKELKKIKGVDGKNSG